MPETYVTLQDLLPLKAVKELSLDAPDGRPLDDFLRALARSNGASRGWSITPEPAPDQPGRRLWPLAPTKQALNLMAEAVRLDRCGDKPLREKGKTWYPAPYLVDQKGFTGPQLIQWQAVCPWLGGQKLKPPRKLLAQCRRRDGGAQFRWVSYYDGTQIDRIIDARAAGGAAHGGTGDTPGPEWLSLREVKERTAANGSMVRYWEEHGHAALRGDQLRSETFRVLGERGQGKSPRPMKFCWAKHIDAIAEFRARERAVLNPQQGDAPK